MTFGNVTITVKRANICNSQVSKTFTNVDYNLDIMILPVPFSNGETFDLT